MIQFSQTILGDLGESTRREWLETNGLGGYASSTVSGIHTRRYHGLLVAATKPPLGRYVLLSKLEKTLRVEGQAFDLCANRYPGTIHPQGHRYLAGFRLDPFPISTYLVKGVELEESIFMVQGENTTVVQFRIINAQPGSELQLELRPLIAFRDHHSLTHENTALNAKVEIGEGAATITPYAGLPSLHMAHTATMLEPAGHWYRNFEYDAERERGLDFTEDLFNPCVLRFDLCRGQDVTVLASTEHVNVADADKYRQAELARRSAVAARSPVNHDFVQALTSAADSYIVPRGHQKTVIAGYHWFGDWGRDTMIALPGLTLPTKQFETALSILQTFARHVDQGMLPNRFPDAGETPEYNTVDATLWFFEAIRAYFAYTGDLGFIRDNLYPALNDIIGWHVRGTRFNIKVDGDGLLNAGESGVQLTWMDAKVGDWVVTPRRGKPVEIQALWYNALCIMEDFARRLGDEAGCKRYAGMATLAKRSFNRLLWNETEQCLYDVVNGGPPDASIRPNQIFAVSLPHSMLSLDRSRLVVDKVREHLLTPYGLRTLSPSDPHYVGRYTGGPASRDGAYHQGTVWPWLMGPFITAWMKVNAHSDAARRQAEEWLLPLHNHLTDAGLGHISEIFEGDAPYRPVGCIAQAWSVAEVLRAMVEDIHSLRPANNQDGYPPAVLKESPDATQKTTGQSAIRF